MSSIATILLLMLSASGALRAIHLHEHHTPAAHSCGGTEHQAPTDDQQQPTPSEDEHECDLCLSLRVMHDALPSVPLAIVESDLVSPTILTPADRVVSSVGSAAHGARAPPVC
jgi:hypothetical protein